MKKLRAESVPYRQPFNIVDSITKVTEPQHLTIGDEAAIWGGGNPTLRYAPAAMQTHEREIACSSKLRTAAVQHLVQHH